MNLKTIRPLILLFSLAGLFSACIGTDIQEVLIVEPEVRITSSIQSLEIGSSQQLEATFTNNEGQEEAVTFTWASDAPEIISVDANGLATAHTEGLATITATYQEWVARFPLTSGNQTVMLQSRNAGFVGQNNYQVSGTATLEEQEGGGLSLSLNSNFRTQNGPGLYVYLSNSPTSVSGGQELGRLQRASGQQTYTVPSGINLNRFDYVIIYCKPFGLPFGSGQFD